MNEKQSFHSDSCTIAIEFLCGSRTLKTESRTWIGVVSHHEVELMQSKWISNNKLPITIETSIDLGYSKCLIRIDEEGIRKDIEGSELLATWKELNQIVKRKPSGCYALYDDGSKPWKISAISSKTNIPASLCPSLSRGGAPTMVLGGFTMHRISGDDMDPMIDTSSKIKAINIFPNSRVLDTCLGLGYTAIEAAKRVGSSGRVTTVEYDDASIEMCSFNPWSQRLFDESLPIDIVEGDVCEVVAGMEDSSFDAIIHDPPARALCRSDLYGLQFYTQLRRILKKNGQLFHYIGNPSSKESGRLYRGIIDRLIQAGFQSVQKVEDAFGLRAF